MTNSDQFPSFSEQAKNTGLLIADVIKDAIQNHQIFASDLEKKRRYDLCQACEHFQSDEKRCKKCGCYMEHKVTFTAAQCPVNKW